MSEFTSFPLAPSEIVYFNGERFSKKVLMGNVDLMHIEAKVGVEALTTAVFAAAFLAAEAVGDIVLQTRGRKAMLGLRTVNALYAEPGAMAVSWPSGSLESSLRGLAERLKANKGRNEVGDILYVHLREDTGNPWQHAVGLLLAGLASRGVLEAREKRVLKIFTSTNYALPESTRALIPGVPAAPVEALLARCQRERPETWKLLTAAIKRAIKLRTEQAEVDTD